MNKSLNDIELMNEFNECANLLMKLKGQLHVDTENYDFDAMKNDIMALEENVTYMTVVALEVYKAMPHLQEMIDEMLINNKKLLEQLNEFKKELSL